MPVTASAGEVEINIAACHDLALSAPVRVTREGRETVYMVSAETFHRRTRRPRRGGLADAGFWRSRRPRSQPSSATG